MSIRVENVSKQFDGFKALDRVSVDVPQGELLALLGPSGSGKTTLLRIIAGLDFPDEGTVLAHDDDVTRQAAKERNVGFVFQHYALFRHLTVFENVAFGLRVRRWKDRDVRTRVHELLSLVKLESLGPRYPSQLSGGQRQRVALARALAARPRVLLLDEPFGALDARVRSDLRQWLRRLHNEVAVTTVFVTHDQEEAFEVADRVVVMNSGRVEQAGRPDEVFEHPASPFVMDFLGQVNVFHGRLHEGKAIVGGVELDCPGSVEHDSGPARVYVRPHELDIETAPAGNGRLSARVTHVNPAGPVTRVQVKVPGIDMELSVELSRDRSAELALKKGDEVYVAPRRVRVFAPAPEYSI
ncbi:MAG TPA: sulfate/molybdate ABC transporter ATP-binding protein [Gemmataceae bacterium]|nr:sulfate/molybdate ABC transporter ATP-binding protein [Gemmataceae bacterium]